MGRRNKKAKRRPDKKKKTKAERRRQEKEVTGTPPNNWSDLPPDLLRCVFERLSFTSLNRAKLVCSSWYSASKGCVPSQNQIPWLIIFPTRTKNKMKKEKRCMFLAPEDKETYYRSRDFGMNFARSDCRATCGSWLLLTRCLDYNLSVYILNPLTGERIDLPNVTRYWTIYDVNVVCFWIDNKTKDYIVVITVLTRGYEKFIKNGFNSWENLDGDWLRCQDGFYNDKSKKLYLHVIVIDRLDIIGRVEIWDFSGDMPSLDSSVSLPRFDYKRREFHPESNTFVTTYRRYTIYKVYNAKMVVTVSGDFLMIRRSFCEPWHFSVYNRNEVDNRWEQTDSLGDEALIYDLNTTVIANGSIPGIKSNSIYFSNRYSRYPDDIFVYDLTTHQVEPLPQCVLSSIPSLIRGRWFFPY